MKRAKFLGVKDDEGDNYDDPDFRYQKGDIIIVFPRFEGYKGPYPWADKPPRTDRMTQAGTNVFRESELEMLPEKELDLNDYL